MKEILLASGAVFVLPIDYQRMWESGTLDAVDLKSSVWLWPDNISEAALGDYRVASLVPFAVTPGRDFYCWLNDRADVTVFSPRDDEMATAFSDRFATAVWRLVLEEMCGVFLEEGQTLAARDVQARYARLAQYLRPDIPAECTSILETIAASQPQFDERWQNWVFPTAAEALTRGLSTLPFSQDFSFLQRPDSRSSRQT